MPADLAVSALTADFSGANLRRVPSPIGVEICTSVHLAYDCAGEPNFDSIKLRLGLLQTARARLNPRRVREDYSYVTVAKTQQ